MTFCLSQDLRIFCHCWMGFCPQWTQDALDKERLTLSIIFWHMEQYLKKGSMSKGFGHTRFDPGSERYRIMYSKGSGVVLNLEVWERPTHATFNKCRNLISLSFLPPKDFGAEREVWELRSRAFPLHYTPGQHYTDLNQ